MTCSWSTHRAKLLGASVEQRLDARHQAVLSYLGGAHEVDWPLSYLCLITETNYSPGITHTMRTMDESQRTLPACVSYDFSGSYIRFSRE